LKLSRIRIEQFRQFRDAIEIDGLQEGINLFTGPNEAGKSTVVAALRAAFFERFRSSAVEDFRPWDDASASPAITVAFEHDGQHYQLMKRFLARKRCELRIGSRMLDGAEAEEELAALMGFQHAGKGASKAEHWGIPGLLWIQQGSGQDIREPVSHATGHLRTALDASLGEVASTQGDDVIAEVQTARDALLTPSTGKPKGIYAAALEKSAELASALAELQAEIDEYRHKVDRLAALRSEHQDDTAEQPWAAFRAQEKTAIDTLREIQGLQDALAMERTQAGRWDSRVELARNRLDAFAAEERTVLARQEALDRATEAQAAAIGLMDPWRSKLEQAEAALATAREHLHYVRQVEARRQLARERAASQTRLDAAAQAAAQADAEQARLIEHRRQAAACRIDEKIVQRLREAELALRELELRRAGVATRLRYRLLDGSRIDIGGEAVRGDGERQLIAPTTLAVPGVGELEIVPGGADLAVLRREQDEWTAQRRDLLDGAGVSRLEDAEARLRAHAAHLAEARNAEATLKGLAPRGIEALRAELSDTQARIAEIDAAAAQSSPNEDTTAAFSVADAEAAAAEAENAVRQASEGWHAARLAEGHARARAEAALRECEEARRALNAEGRAARLADAERELAHAGAERHAALERADALERQVAQSRPDILRQDIERFRRSAEQHEKRHHERRDVLFRLEAELQVAGAQGLDERQAEVSRDLAQARRQAAELEQQARALDYLLALLRDKRATLTRRLQAPLRRCLQHYVDLLFPQARVDIDEDLMLGALTRVGPRGSEISVFDALSFGAREQVGVIARLAYADLLREAGRPTLIILDDALVHSDDARLAQMKRVLFDAGTRHQILLFTCHPLNWRDIGVAPRPLGGSMGSLENA
jgi:DNA repair exonuclease SbcCD ATPase subunit